MPADVASTPHTHAEAPSRRHAAVLAVAALATLAAAPLAWQAPPASVAVAATALVILGVPHGAVDHRVARPLLRPRLGRLWFPAFTLLYLGAAALVLWGWTVSAPASLAAFLLLSVLHFGTEDAEGRDPVERLTRGGAPVALAILFHPDRTERFFAVLGGTPDLFAALQAAAWAWVPVAGFTLARMARDPAPCAAWVEAAALVAAFAALPPVAAFAFYFLLVHSPRHVHELALRHAPDDPARGWRWVVRRSVPLSLATAAVGLALFLALGGPFEERFLRTVFWGLAALTVPHMVLHVVDRRAGSPPLR